MEVICKMSSLDVHVKNSLMLMEKNDHKCNKISKNSPQIAEKLPNFYAFIRKIHRVVNIEILL